METDGGVDLFVYGTLMDEALVLELTGRRFERRAAVLPDHVRVEPRGGYPYLVPRPGGRVEGLLLRGVDPASLARLDAYEEEGRLYRRQRVAVRAGDATRRCHTYVGLRGARGR